MAQKEQLEKDLEDMHIELLSFCKTLKPSNMHKALQLKEKLENAGQPPKHFRVSVYSLWQKGFKHDQVANYKYVKEKMEDLLVAEKNLNRNIDSEAQLDIFIKTAREVKDGF